jgi:hypothetical protein
MSFGFANDPAHVRQACTRWEELEASAEGPDAKCPGLFVEQRPAERCRQVGVTPTLETASGAGEARSD